MGVQGHQIHPYDATGGPAEQFVQVPDPLATLRNIDIPCYPIRPTSWGSGHVLLFQPCLLLSCHVESLRSLTSYSQLIRMRSGICDMIRELMSENRE
jgi:hypothetical protein